MRDQNGRLVAVEVEPTCDPGHIAGPLQCMKYRSLLAYFFDRRPQEVRTVLVSLRICRSDREKATGYDIECVEIESPTVAASPN